MTVNELYDLFERGGTAFGILVEDKLVGVLTIDVPNDVFGVSYEDYHEEANSENTIYIENCAVIPDYRGNGFQRILVLYAEEWLKRTVSKCEYFMCTVSPNNRPSHYSMEKIGYSVIATDRMYGDNLRDVLCKVNKWLW